MDLRTICFSYCLILLLLPRQGHAQIVERPEVFRDSVQVILEQFAQAAPEKVLFLQETQRWCLKEARAEAIDEAWLVQLQDAFYADIKAYCRFYGWRYLVNWRALLAKAARETFWGTSYLCNRTYNYFGIRAKAKPWICDSFGFCETIEKNDPDLAAFAIFPNFESSLWMFIHTIYSRHYLDRLPDLGSRVVGAIEFERRFGFHYWEGFDRGFTFPQELGSRQYSIEETLATWSGHEINNLCVNCSWETDLKWIEKVNRTAGRTR
ncbi:MAG: glucosaminidase domain-containing protein [Cyanothece sp. SIO1E1]|nr:glucosaminidase domain-containing protein [Cyanothece sp. SIO1E1]